MVAPCLTTNLAPWDSPRDNLAPWVNPRDSLVQWASHKDSHAPWASPRANPVQWASLLRESVQVVFLPRECAQVACLLRARDPTDLLLMAVPETYLETLLADALLSEDATAGVEHSLLDRLGLSGNVSIRKTLLSKISECSQKHKRNSCQG